MSPRTQLILVVLALLVVGAIGYGLTADRGKEPVRAIQHEFNEEWRELGR